MKKTFLILTIFFIVCSLSTNLMAKKKKYGIVKNSKDTPGMFYAHYRIGKLKYKAAAISGAMDLYYHYVVDTVTQQCFANSTILFPCKALAKRSEWTEIITWE